MKKIIIGLACCFSLSANAEIVKNSKGEKVELKPNGTWSFVKMTDDDYVLNAKYYDVILKDGNKQDTVVNVIPNINLDGAQKLTRDRASFAIKLTEMPISLQLKNKYSYVPKKVLINQSGSEVKVTIEYLAKNSYGADTVGTQTKSFTMDQSGQISPILER